MRIGIYGGTFDPVHYGHLLLAETCREACSLDEVWFLPAQISPHKLDVQVSPPVARVDMLEFAIAAMPEFKVVRMEVDRPGPSYTVETLEQIRKDRPEDELFLFLGADSVTDFPTWRDPARISELATLVVVNRGREAPRPLPADLVRPGGRGVVEVTMPGIDLSASDIRRRVAEGKSIRFHVPRPVEHYIREKRLYLPSESVSA